MTITQETLLEIVRIGIGGRQISPISEKIDWLKVFEIAQTQGVAGVAFDGIERLGNLNIILDIDKDVLFQWIGIAKQIEQRYLYHEKAIRGLAKFYNKHAIKMMVLKGYGLSLNYPTPNHRPTGDIDIYLFGEQEKADVMLHDELGIEIDKSHHHHTVFKFEGEAVENHYDFLNVHVRPSNKRMEAKLKMLANDNVIFDVNDNLLFPSVEFNAIYLLRHCAAHFASTEMTIRQVLDWGFFIEKHQQNINWDEYIPYIKQEGMFRFYNLLGLFCMKHLGFDASIFHGVYNDELFERFSNEILSPEFEDRENGKLLHSLSVKPRRWWHNRWKNRLCYPDSTWSEFAYGLWAKILKPSHFWQ